MQRVPEAELMDQDEQARAYAGADFSQPHNHFIELLAKAFPQGLGGVVLDLGCGPADISIRLARACPGCQVHGVDGALAMLECGREAVQQAGLQQRIRLMHGYLPGAELPLARYDAVISNSLLHHLAEPGVLWQTIRQYAVPGAPVLIMDLRRPDAIATARDMVGQYAAAEPALLQQDFYRSLLAAYTPEEVRGQLEQHGLGHFTLEVVSDRHWVVYGRA